MVLRRERKTPAPPAYLTCRTSNAIRGTQYEGTQFPCLETATIEGTKCVQRKPSLPYIPKRMESLVEETFDKHKLTSEYLRKAERVVRFLRANLKDPG
jgi:hypothetical protein